MNRGTLFQFYTQECGIAYEPVHLLRCHSVDNDPTDWKTNVWKCSFEPNVEVEGKHYMPLGIIAAPKFY